MLIYNLQSSDVPPALRLVNGSRGVVRRMLSLEECRELLKTQLYDDYAMQIQALDHFVGCCGRDSTTLRFPEVEFLNKVVRVITPVSFTTRPYGGGRASRLQVPLILAWALTVHKSQGSSLDFVDVDCKDFFAEGQVYVALSRARSKDGMRVRNFNVKKSRELSAKNADTLAFYDAITAEQDEPGSVARALSSMQPWWTAVFSPGVSQEWRQAFIQSSVFQWWCRAAAWERSRFHLFAAVQHLNSARMFLHAHHSNGVAPSTVKLLRFRSGVSVHSVVITHVERLRIIADAATAKLVQRMSRMLKFPVFRSAAARLLFAVCILKRVAARRSEHTAEALYLQGLRLYASGNYAEAAAAYRRSIAEGHLPPRADLAHMMIDGRNGIERSKHVLSEAFQLVGQGASAECPHCQGVLARCYFRVASPRIPRNAALSLQLARASSDKGCRYGQYVLGTLLVDGAGGAVNDTEAVRYLRLSASQGLDVAQKELGDMHEAGRGVVRDRAEALRLYKLAAEQGLADAIFRVATYYDEGWCVLQDRLEAKRLCGLALQSDYDHAGALDLWSKLSM